MEDRNQNNTNIVPTSSKNISMYVFLAIIIVLAVSNVTAIMVNFRERSELWDLKNTNERLGQDKETMLGIIEELEEENNLLKTTLYTKDPEAVVSSEVMEAVRKKARDARRVSDLRQIALALEMFYDDNGSYPKVLSELESGDMVYMMSVPTDQYHLEAEAGLCAPDYCYAYPAAEVIDTYHLGAQLEVYNDALDLDADFNSQATSYKGNPFDGDDSILVYDIQP